MPAGRRRGRWSGFVCGDRGRHTGSAVFACGWMRQRALTRRPPGSCHDWKSVWNAWCGSTRRWRSRRRRPWQRSLTRPNAWQPPTIRWAPRGFGRRRKARRWRPVWQSYATRAGLMPDLRRGVLPGLLDAVLEGEVVRSRRALRGRGGVEHPRVHIWGLLEARLQSVDLVVLGGLAETVWPPMAEPGPWLSRPMRTRVGLPAPEEAVGQAAHDFVAACCSAPVVVLSCPVRRDNAPAVPARWLTRLDMFLAGRQPVPGRPTDAGPVKNNAPAEHDNHASLPEHPAVGWARVIDLPDGPPNPVKPPRPAPPVGKRPRKTQRHRDRDLAARPVRHPCPLHPSFIRDETAG